MCAFMCCVCVRACMHACMFVCVHLHVCMCVCVCVCVLDVEESRAFTSRALVTVQTAVYLTGYSDCLNHSHHLINITLV